MLRDTERQAGNQSDGVSWNGALEERVRCNLKNLRRSYGWSLKELAKRTYLNQTVLHRMESGGRDIKLNDLPVLARGLGCDVGDLLGELPGEPLFEKCSHCKGRGVVSRLSAPDRGVEWKEGQL